MPGQSVESITEEEARSRSAWPHWKGKAPVEAPGKLEDDTVLESTVACLEAAVDAVDAAAQRREVDPGVAQRLVRAAARIRNIEANLKPSSFF